MERRNKLSPPPPAAPSDGDRVVLAGFVHSHGYELILDAMQRYCIAQEVELFVGDVGDRERLLGLALSARNAWLILDAVQFAVHKAIEDETEAARRRMEATQSQSQSTEEILSAE